KAYVSGLEAANRVIEKLGTGYAADIIPIVPDEPHIQAARVVNKAVREIGQQFLPQFWLP
ncbi:MAG: amine oxidase, partial [Cyanobacteria bacterium J06629_9]